MQVHGDKGAYQLPTAHAFVRVLCYQVIEQEPLDGRLLLVVATRAGQPRGISSPADEGARVRIPLDFLTVAVRQIQQVANDGGTTPDDFVGDGLRASLYGAEEVVAVRVRNLFQLDLGVL